jgi:hypothetical protein
MADGGDPKRTPLATPCATDGGEPEFTITGAGICVTGDSICRAASLEERLGPKVWVSAVDSAAEARFEALSAEPLCHGMDSERYPIIMFLGFGKGSSRCTVRDTRRNGPGGGKLPLYTSEGGDIGFTKHDAAERMEFVARTLAQHNKKFGLDHRPIDFLVIYAGGFHRTPKAFQTLSSGTLLQMDAPTLEKMVSHPFREALGVEICPPVHVLQVGGTLGDGILPIGPNGNITSAGGVVLLTKLTPVMSMRKVVPVKGPGTGKLIYINYLSAFAEQSKVSSGHWFDVGSGEIGYTRDPASGDAKKVKHDGSLEAILKIIGDFLKMDG